MSKPKITFKKKGVEIVTRTINLTPTDSKGNKNPYLNDPYSHKEGYFMYWDNDKNPDGGAIGMTRIENIINIKK